MGIGDWDEVSEDTFYLIYCKCSKDIKSNVWIVIDYGLVGYYENESIECLDLNELINKYHNFHSRPPSFDRREAPKTVGGTAKQLFKNNKNYI